MVKQTKKKPAGISPVTQTKGVSPSEAGGLNMECALNTIRDWLRQHKYTPTQLARDVGISPTMMSLLLNTKYRGDATKNLKRILSFLDALESENRTTVAAATRNQRMVSDYVLYHLAAVGKEAGDLGEDLLEDKICAAGKPYDVEKRRVILRERLINTLGYIAAGWRDLYVAAIVAGRAEKKDGCSGTDPGGIGQQG